MLAVIVFTVIVTAAWSAFMIMIVNITAARESFLARLVLCKLKKFRGGYSPLGNLNQFKREADNLFFIDRGPQLVKSARIFPVELDHLTFLARKLARALNHGAA